MTSLLVARSHQALATEKKILSSNTLVILETRQIAISSSILTPEIDPENFGSFAQRLEQFVKCCTRIHNRL